MIICKWLLLVLIIIITMIKAILLLALLYISVQYGLKFEPPFRWTNFSHCFYNFFSFSFLSIHTIVWFFLIHRISIRLGYFDAQIDNYYYLSLSPGYYIISCSIADSTSTSRPTPYTYLIR